MGWMRTKERGRMELEIWGKGVGVGGHVDALTLQ